MTKNRAARAGARSAVLVGAAAWIGLAAGCASEKSAGPSDLAARRRAAAAASREEAQPEDPPALARRPPVAPAARSKPGSGRQRSPPDAGPPSPPSEGDPEVAEGGRAAPSSPPPDSAEAAEAPRDVARYIRELQSTPETAEEAFRRLWEVPAPLIPGLIEEVNNPRPTRVKELTVLVLQTESIARLDEATGKFVYRIRGMGEFYLDDIASGPAPRNKGLRVKLTCWGGFPVGVVLRAALLNRFRNPDLPAGDDRADLVGWWRRYHEKVRPSL